LERERVDKNNEGIQCRLAEDSDLGHVDVVMPIDWHMDTKIMDLLRKDIQIRDRVVMEIRYCLSSYP